MNGVDLKTVQELLGHKDIKMTLRYAHLSQAHKKEAVRALEKLVYHDFIAVKMMRFYKLLKILMGDAGIEPATSSV